jgi:hypothetical protein
VVAILSRRAAKAAENPKARWGVWILPWLLSLDNITYGAVDGVSHGASMYSIPAVRRHMWLANGVAGGLMIIGVGVLHQIG